MRSLCLASSASRRFILSSKVAPRLSSCECAEEVGAMSTFGKPGATLTGERGWDQVRRAIGARLTHESRIKSHARTHKETHRARRVVERGWRRLLLPHAEESLHFPTIRCLLA
mmetsp:Transcript_4049/g.15025  ORF Transcript_4049/g.15025 Transcript_4049/m.15025 type:complete len:113 (+) Transcript_4049:657-995(+)